MDSCQVTKCFWTTNKALVHLISENSANVDVLAQKDPTQPEQQYQCVTVIPKQAIQCREPLFFFPFLFFGCSLWAWGQYTGETKHADIHDWILERVFVQIQTDLSSIQIKTVSHFLQLYTQFLMHTELVEVFLDAVDVSAERSRWEVTN